MCNYDAYNQPRNNIADNDDSSLIVKMSIHRTLVDYRLVSHLLVNYASHEYQLPVSDSLFTIRR